MIKKSMTVFVLVMFLFSAITVTYAQTNRAPVESNARAINVAGEDRMKDRMMHKDAVKDGRDRFRSAKKDFSRCVDKVVDKDLCLDAQKKLKNHQDAIADRYGDILRALKSRLDPTDPRVDAIDKCMVDWQAARDVRFDVQGDDFHFDGIKKRHMDLKRVFDGCKKDLKDARRDADRLNRGKIASVFARAKAMSNALIDFGQKNKGSLTPEQMANLDADIVKLKAAVAKVEKAMQQDRVQPILTALRELKVTIDDVARKWHRFDKPDWKPYDTIKDAVRDVVPDAQVAPVGTAGVTP